MLSELLSRVRSYRQSQAIELGDAYRRLVESLANDEDVTPEKVAVVLDDAGKSEGQLADDVQLMLDRRGWASQLRQSEDAQTLLRKTDEQIQKVVTQRDKEVAKFDAQLDQLRAQRADAERLTAINHQAASNLSATCNDAGLLLREEQVACRLQALIPRQREIDHTLRQLQRSIWGIESDIERTENDYKIGFTSEARGATVERIANLKTSLRNRQAEYRQLASEERSTRDQIHELQAELDGIAKRKLIP